MGANPYIRDKAGMSVLDYVNESSPMWEIFAPFRIYHERIERTIQKRLIRRSISQVLNHFSLMDSLSPRDQWVDHGCLAFLFVHLGQEAEARILLESSLLKMRNGTILSGFECSRCHKRRGKGPFYACSECQSTILCDECYVKRSDEWLQIGPALGITRSSLAHQLINP
jgi:hypothetical protein